MGGGMPVEISFASAIDAARVIAGVSAAARAVKELSDSGILSIRIQIGDDAPIGPAVRADIERLRGRANVEFARGSGPSLTSPTAWQVIVRTGKPGDGLVSRWLNRPVSQRLTWVTLRLFPSIRPIHITLVNALLALALIPIMTLGDGWGLIAGGIMFHAASVLDGVDGEIARATWRTSALGATLDSIVDIATNLLFVSGLTINLALRDGDYIGWLGLWALVLSIVGGALIAWRSASVDRPISFDLLKRAKHKTRTVFDIGYCVVQTLTGRDCFAFLYMILILVGLERLALFIYSGVGTIWIIYVAGVLAFPRFGHGRDLASASDRG